MIDNLQKALRIFITNTKAGKLLQKAKRTKKVFSNIFVLGACFECSGQQEL